jgi:sugar phosphate isomerase/epimerase
MKVGLTIQSLGAVKPSHLVKLVNIVGIDHIEFDPTVFEDLDDLHIISTILGNKSVTLHAPFFMHWGYDLSSIHQAEKVEQYLTHLEQYAGALKAHSVVVHPPLDPEGDQAYFIKNLNRIPITVYLENMPGQRLADFATWYFATKAQTTAKTEICFDVPHSFLTHGTDGLFDLDDRLLPDLNYIHISELTAHEDNHWPFGTPGGELPFDQFHAFVKRIGFDGTINMEMLPADLDGIKNLLGSFLKLLKLGSKWQYFRKWLRVTLVKPLLLSKMKDVPLQSNRFVVQKIG